MTLEIPGARSIRGALRPPSDKSITHRAMMLAAAANGRCIVRHPLMGDDCRATLRCLEQMGLRVESGGPEELWLDPAPEWRSPDGDLDCGNSGTTMRLLAGMVASRSIEATLVGDASLSRRPMKRIADPLGAMGALVEGDHPPLRIRGATLTGIRYESPIASAQIKSCVLLAGLRARGETTVVEPALSRDHTERLLDALGVRIDREREGRGVTVNGGAEIPPFEIAVPSDPSSAAFLLVAAAILPDSEVTLRTCCVNPTRTGYLDLLQEAGVDLDVRFLGLELGEPVADLAVRSGKPLRGFEAAGGHIPRIIDEIPILSVLATQCEGTTTFRDASELRVKESDRIEAIAHGLRSMGARVETFDDGLAIHGPVKLKGARIEARGDHRIAMAFAIAGLVAEGTTTIDGAETIQSSFPGFESILRRLTTD